MLFRSQGRWYIYFVGIISSDTRDGHGKLVAPGGVVVDSAEHLLGAELGNSFAQDVRRHMITNFTR